MITNTLQGEETTNRMIKTQHEIDCISKAAALGDKCFSYILGYIKPGMSEKQVAIEIEKYLFANGAEGLAFDTISVSGERTCLPHGEPTDRLIQKGELLTLDFGGIIGGYCGDMTRTIAIGSISSEQKRVYEIVLEAQLAAIDFIKAGVSCFDADKVARDIICKADYGNEFPHGLGHGVGTKVHEAPTLNAKSTEILEKNMAITIEPGIYITDRFGVRIEDLAIVTDFGIINKVKSEKGLIIL